MKKYVSDILDYLKYQLEHDQCSMEQMQRIARKMFPVAKRFMCECCRKKLYGTNK